jgi:colanic acid biosynthesis glycosyl transferase WcaI
VKIIIHTQYYPPEIGAPQTRLHELAVGLHNKGVDVTVLTAMPNYPHGRIHTGYGGWLKKETLDGIQIIRTGIYPVQSTRMIPRLLNYFSFVFSSLLIGGFQVARAEYLMTESPPLFLGIAGFLLSRWKRAKWIFNISDLWPQSVVELGILNANSLGYKVAGALESFLYKNAWAVTGQAKTILAHINARFPGLHTYHLSNGVDTRYFQPGGAAGKNKKFRFVYAGLHGLAQGLQQILKAAKKLPADAQVDFMFVGDGPEKQTLIQMAQDLELNRVQFLDAVSKDNMPEILRSADALIVPLKIQLTGAVPSKLYEAMAMGKPVILVAGSEAADIVNESGCGIVVQPGDIDALASAILQLRSHPIQAEQMGQNGRRAAVQKYDRINIAQDFLAFLHATTKSK